LSVVEYLTNPSTMKISAASLLLATLGAAEAFVPTFGTAKRGTQQSASILSARRPFISGNWKLNPSNLEEALVLGKAISDSVTPESPCDVALFVPYVFIEQVKELAGGKVSIGAEGVCPEMKGAFTGAVSAPQIQSLGLEWALAGHSERRIIFGEDDSYINGQCLKIIENKMSVMLCIGETETEYNLNLAGAICAVQLKKGLANIKPEEMSRVAIAYEPVWAIGTGKVATPEIAQSVHKQVRNILADMYGTEIADQTRILYGGSVTPESVDDLMQQPDIDGALVGGASLDASKFSRIINFTV